jgi:hypothetical protein
MAWPHALSHLYSSPSLAALEKKLWGGMQARRRGWERRWQGGGGGDAAGAGGSRARLGQGQPMPASQGAGEGEEEAGVVRSLWSCVARAHPIVRQAAL